MILLRKTEDAWVPILGVRVARTHPSNTGTYGYSVSEYRLSAATGTIPPPRAHSFTLPHPGHGSHHILREQGRHVEERLSALRRR